MQSKLTRRAVLAGAPAVAVAAALPAFAAPVDDSETLLAVAQWRQGWAAMLRTETYLEEHPEFVRDDERYYASEIPRILQGFSDARNRLLATAPQSIAGAVAVLGCAATVFEARERGQADPLATPERRVLCRLFWQGEHEMARVAHDALQRLTGGAL
jgi:hypothetical protein